MLKIKWLTKASVQKLCNSPIAQLVCLASGVVTLLLFPSALVHELTVEPIRATAPATVAVLEKSGGPRVARPARSATAQSSVRIESPNVSHIRHDVKIQYDSIPAGMSEGSRVNASPDGSTSSAPVASTIRTYRVQSPDVTDIGGSVDIRYGSPTSAGTDKSPESPK